MNERKTFDDWWEKNVNPLEGYFKKSGTFLAGIFIISAWLLSGLYIVAPDEQGVVTRFGKWVDTTQPGLHYHLPSPIEEVYKIQVTKVQRMDIGSHIYMNSNGELQEVDIPEESLILTGDENIVNLNFSIFWIISNPGQFLFQLDNPLVTIKALAESAMREAVGKNKLQYALTDGRKEIEIEVQKIMQESLDDYKSGVRITEVKLQKVDPPQQVIDSFRDVQAAEADRIRSTNEAEAYANSIIPKSRGTAEEITQQAQAYKYDKIRQAEGEAKRFNSILEEYKSLPSLTKQRMYMEKMGGIFAKNKNKILFNTSNDVKDYFKVIPYLDMNNNIGNKG